MGRARGFWTKLCCTARLDALSEASTGDLPERRVSGGSFAASKSSPFSEWRVIRPKSGPMLPRSGLRVPLASLQRFDGRSEATAGHTLLNWIPLIQKMNGFGLTFQL